MATVRRSRVPAIPRRSAPTAATSTSNATGPGLTTPIARDAWQTEGAATERPQAHTTHTTHKEPAVAQVVARGPATSPREPAVVVTRTLDDERTIALRDDGSARMGALVLRAGLSLPAHGDLPCLQHLAPLVDDQGPLVLVRDTPRDHLVRMRDGVVAASGGALFVVDGAFCVARGGLLHDGGGGLVGVVRPGDPPTPLRFRGPSLLVRQLARALRDDGVLRRIDGPEGPRWHTFEGFVVDTDGTVASLQHSLGATPTESSALYQDGDGAAWLVKLDRGGAQQTLHMTRAPEGPVSSTGAAPGTTRAVRGGRLVVLDDARPGLLFTLEGAPCGRVDGTSPTPGELIDGRSGGRFVAVRNDAGSVAFVRVEHSAGDEHVVHVDGAATIVNARGRCRQGALGDPPSMIVAAGVALTVIASSNAGRRLVARGEGRMCVYDARSRAGVVELTPRDASGEAFAVRRNGVLEEVVQDGQSFAVARAPLARAALGNDLLAALDAWTLGERGMVGDVALARAAAQLCADVRALLDNLAFEPALTDPRARRLALAAEVARGAGPWIDALGGSARVDRALGLLGGDDLVVAFRDGGGRVRRMPASFQGPGAAHQVALFRLHDDEVVPLTIAEVQARFDAEVRPAPPWSSTTACTVVVERDQAGALHLHAQGPTLDRRIDVEGSAGPDHPTLAQLTAWLAALPVTALRALEHVRFGPPDANGQAKFAPATGTLTYAATPGFFAEQGLTTTIHEVVGHGLEQSDPRVLRALVMARVLDGAGGAWVATRDPYGDTNLAESFAVGVQELFAPPPLGDDARARHPAFARLVDALLAGTFA